MKLVFKKLPDPNNDADQTTVEVVTEQATLPEVLQVIEDYLRGCGFIVDGFLEIVEDDYDGSLR